MRILYTSDLHGKSGRYHDLELLVSERRPDLVILGGDLLPHYGHTQSSIDRQIEYVKNEFKQFLSNLPRAVQVAFIPGNDDWAACLPSLSMLADMFPLHAFADRSLIIGDMEFIGYGFVTPTPFLAKDFDKLDQPEDMIPDYPPIAYTSYDGKIASANVTTLLHQRTSIQEDLCELRAEAHSVFVAHVPPFGTRLDLLRDKQPVGSRSIRSWIRRHRPVLSLHGHIHESPQVSGQYWDRIGNTLCINPGQMEDALSAVIIEMENHTLLRVSHTVYGEINL